MTRITILLSVLVLLSGPAAYASAAELAEAACYECHDDLQEDFARGTSHEPVAEGDCESCHEDHGEDYELILSDEVPALCFNCHDEYEGSHQHEPVADGDCLSCHNVHNSEVSAMLTAEVPALCFDCHDELSEEFQHEPVADGDCMGCHNAHDSESSAMLTGEVPDLCADCHDDADASGGKHPHEPVAGGECMECHHGHESSQAALLTEAYAGGRYLQYEAESYQLCYNCHDQKAFETEAAGDLTEFRHGENNLHYLHVYGKIEVNKYGMKKQKDGMTCVGCHLTHGTEQPKMIRHVLECKGTFCYTINFRKFEGGGTCVVGCHKPKVYKLEGKASVPEKKTSSLAKN